MAPAALNWLNAHRRGLALPPHGHGGLPRKKKKKSHGNSTELVLMATFLPNDLRTASHQRPEGGKKNKNARSSGEDFKTTRDGAANPVQGEVVADLFGLHQSVSFFVFFFCFTQVKHESGRAPPPPMLATHATQLFLNRQSDVKTSHHSGSGSGYLAEISSVYDARAGTGDECTRVRARARERANHSPAPCVQS